MKKVRFCVLFFLFILLLIRVTAVSQDNSSLLSKDVLRALNNEISGELIQEYIRYIGHFSRLQPSRGYHEAAEWMVEAAKKAGLSDVHIEKYASDGEVYHYMYKTAPAWDVEFGELWIVEPEEEKLTSYAEIPVSLAINSRSCDVKAKLVYVGEGSSPDDYEKVSVREKVVLAEGSIGTVANLAVDRFGALGVVVVNQRFSHENPDVVSSIRLRTKTPAFGFGLSHRRGEELIARMKQEEDMVVRAVIKTEIHPWPLENVVAVIPGNDLANEEIILTAHLCHYKPGANDNASGSASILEVGRVLKKLIDEGKIKQPKRTIRFLWVPEMSGSIAYAAAHPEIIEKMTAGINLDMVGQYLNDNNSTFFLHLTPHSRPHYINDLLINLTEFMAANNVEGLMDNNSGFSIFSLSGSRDSFRYRIQGYTGGSDQWVFNDGLIKVPMPFFLVWPDHFYHTSGDKPEICDPTQLKRSAFLAAAASVFLLDDCPHKARRLAGEIFARAKSRISLETKRCFRFIDQADKEGIHSAYKESLNFIEQSFKREETELRSLKKYSYRDVTVDGYVDDLIKLIHRTKEGTRKDVQDFYQLTCDAREIIPAKIILSPEERKADKEIPVRNPELKGPLNRSYLQEKFAGEEKAFALPVFQTDSRIAYEILNFIDGKNSLLEIRNAVSAEFEPVPVEWIKDFVDLLKKAGIVS